MLRNADLKHFAFRAPLLIFYIPLDETLGPLQNMAITHEADQETELILQYRDPKIGLIYIPFQEVENAMNVQHMEIIQKHLETFSEMESFNQPIESFQKKVNALYEVFPQEPLLQKALSQTVFPNIHELTPVTFEQFLIKLNQSDPLEPVLMQYAKKMQDLILSFLEDMDQVLSRIPLSNIPPSMLTAYPPLLSSIPDKIEDLEPDTRKALSFYAGILGTAAFVAWVLPKFLKKPFSKMAWDYSIFHNRLFNLSWTRAISEKLFPEFVHASPSRLAQFIRSMGGQENKYRDLIGSAEQFKRAFAQCSGGTLAVIATELLTRPFYRSTLDAEAPNAIFLSQPFSQTHSLWIQKNVLYRMLNGFILGSISTTGQIAILEREYMRLLQEMVLDTHLESTLAFSLTQEQRRMFVEGMHRDLTKIRSAVQREISEVLAQGLPASNVMVTTKSLPETIQRIRDRWIQTLESMNPHPSHEAFIHRARLETTLTAKLTATTQLAIERFSRETRAPGKIKKMGLILSSALHQKLAHSLGSRTANEISSISRKTWELWAYGLQPKLWNDFTAQMAFRGSFNLTYFAYCRLLSLVWALPLYVGTYEVAKTRFGAHGLKGEFLYGFSYNLICGYLYNLILLHAYEKPLMNTAFDLELSKYFKN